MYYKACTKSFPVLLCTTKLAQNRSQYYCVLQSLHQSTSQYYWGFAASPIDTATWAQQNERGFAAIDTATAQDKQRQRFCSFPHRHGDARGEAETEVWNSPIDMATCAQQNERGFAAFPIDTELTMRKTSRKTLRRLTGGEQGSSPQTPRL